MTPDPQLVEEGRHYQSNPKLDYGDPIYSSDLSRVFYDPLAYESALLCALICFAIAIMTIAGILIMYSMNLPAAVASAH